jgi:hypothetical protein
MVWKINHLIEAGLVVSGPRCFLEKLESTSPDELCNARLVAVITGLRISVGDFMRSAH